MNTVAAAGDLPVGALRLGGVVQAGVPGEGDGDGAAVHQAHGQPVGVEGDACHPFVSDLWGRSHAAPLASWVWK